MKILQISMIVFLSFSALSAQEVEKRIIKDSFLTLDRVQELAYENYPSIKRFGIIEKNKELALLKADWDYLPSIVLGARTSYQTEIVEFPQQMIAMGGDQLSKDQYQVFADINQVIWDGGNARLNRQVAKQDALVQQTQLEVELYAIKSRINDLYFGYLLIEEAINQSDLHRERLDINFKMLEASFEKGIVSRVDLDQLRVSILELEQKKIELIAAKDIYIKSISLFVGYDIDGLELRKPMNQSLVTTALVERRPEFVLFKAQRNLADSKIKQVDVRKVPKLSFFMQGAYGRPGYDMLDNSFRPYAILGFKMSWSISNFFYSKRVKGLLNYDATKNIDIAKELFLFNLNQQISRESADITKLRELIKKDEEMLAIRKSIRKSSEERVFRGLITVTDMLNDINSENQVSLNKIIHEMELLKVMYSVKNTLNN